MAWRRLLFLGGAAGVADGLLTSDKALPVGVDGGDLKFADVPGRVAFGSCAKQYRHAALKEVWSSIAATKPDVWLWTGDAMYCPESTVGGMRDCYNEQKENPDYQKLRENVKIIDGCIDDHDYGLNDGDRLWHYREEAKNLFLDFLDVPSTSPRRQRPGTYVSHTYGEPPHQVKVIMMDVRFNKDLEFVRGIGQYRITAAAIVAAVMRWHSQFLAIGRNFEGDLLGEKQWQWLEQQLKESQANVHILISSIQVLTPFNIVESWGHYPAAQRRLFNLLKATRPQGLVLLSGDVHFAQILGDPEGVSEITSSGMTHSCAEYVGLWDMTQAIIMPNKTDYSCGKNFGYMDLSFLDLQEPAHDSGAAVVETSVRTKLLSSAGEPLLNLDLKFRSDEDPSRRIQYLESLPPFFPEIGIIQVGIRLGALVTLWCTLVLLALFSGNWLLSKFSKSRCEDEDDGDEASDELAHSAVAPGAKFHALAKSPTRKESKDD